jgi:hypothetical protein
MLPSTLNWTPRRAILSEALAETLRELERVEPLTGEVMETVGKIMSMVENLLTLDQELTPEEFLALTLQKYKVLEARPLTDREVSLRVESFTISETKRLSVASWNRYVDVPAELFHLSVSDTGWFVAPLEGVTSIGVAGGNGAVVRFQICE